MLKFLCFIALVLSANGARLKRQVSESEQDTQVNEETPTTPKLNITKLHIRSDVSLRFATTYVTSHVVNRGQSAAEVAFELRMPKTAFITNFTMEIDGRNYTGSVKEKEQANKEYQRAVSRGQSAAQVKKSPRGTDRFSVNVNVAAQGDVTFYLVYQELLKRRHGVYTNVIYVDPGQVVPDFRIVVHINETRELTELSVPPMSAADEILPPTLEMNPDAIVETISPSEMVVYYEPTAQKQRENSEKGLSGKFVVRYDVLRNFDGGEVAVEDGYFVHFFAPKTDKFLFKNVLFVLDASGSMYGTKMRQVKEAMEKIFSELRSGDYFNIIRFSTASSRWFTESAMMTATPENKARALTYVNSLEATGGTNVNDAVLQAVDLLSQHDAKVRNSRTEDGKTPELSSMIIFLTDGDPTSGVTNTGQILRNVRSRNEGRFPLYSLGFGHTVNFKFLKKLSLQNSGFARKIYEDSDAGLQLEGFFRELATPLLNDVTFDYVGGVNDSTLTRRIFPTYYNGSEIMICGAFSRDNRAEEMKSIIYARSRDDIIDIELPILFPRPFPPRPRPRPHKPGRIERLWAYQTINQYLEYMLASTNDTEKANYRAKALALSLKYQFVTDLTSMVVVKPDQSEALPDTRDQTRPNNNYHSVPRTNYRARGRVPYSSVSGGGRAGSRGLPAPVGLSGSSSYDLMPQSVAGMRPSQIHTPDSANSPRRKKFGYSFADGDPHFLVTVRGSPGNKPLCFNIRGEANSTYLLLRDTVHDAMVTGTMIQGELQLSGNKRRTYFGQMTVKVGTLTLTITPATIKRNDGNAVSWTDFNATIADDDHIYMPTKHAVKIRLNQGSDDSGTGATLVVARHRPRRNQNQTVAYLGFYVEDIGLLSGTAEGLTGDFAHSRVLRDMSRPGVPLIRYSKTGAPPGRIVKVREITRRNLVTKQHLPCLFVDYNGRDVLKRPVQEYKIDTTRIDTN